MALRQDPTEHDILAALRECERNCHAGAQRDHAVLRIVHATGLHPQCLLDLTLAAYHDEPPALHVHSKRGGAREVVIPPLPHRALQRWLRTRGDAPGPLFCSTQGILSNRRIFDSPQRASLAGLNGATKRYATEAGVDAMTALDIRRAVISRFASEMRLEAIVALP